MKILYLCSSHPSYDKRVYHKISKSLVENGHEVINLHPNVKRELTADRIRIESFPQKKGIVNRIVSLKKLFSIGKNIKADIIIAPEPDSIFIAFLLKLTNRKIKVVFDCHEWYEIHFKEKFKNKAIGSILNKVTEYTLGFISKRIDAVICVNETMRKKYMHYNNNSFCIPNTLKIKEEVIEDDKTKKDFIYTGNFCDSKQERILIDAALKLKKEGSKAKINILGGFINNESYKQNCTNFNSLIERNNLERNIEILPWVDANKAKEILSGHLGGITRFDSYLYGEYHCLPNKIFDYMSVNLAIITCKLNKETAAIVSENECGILVSEETGEALAEAIMYMNNNIDETFQQGRNSYKAIANEYNWLKYEKELLKIIDCLSLS